MTRELKLAMVIGFALLLMLAIVVSDHFSTGAADHSTLVASAQPRLAEAAPPVALRSTVPPPAPEARGASPRSESRSISTDSTLAATTRRTPEVRPAVEVRPVPRFSSDAPPARPVGDLAPTAAAEPAPRTYRVAEGDSLSSIATSFYGDGTLWNKLAAVNRDRLPDPDRMRVGLLLVIPDREALADPAPREGSGATASATAVRDPLVAEVPRTHVVGEGETLSEIAATHLGSARRWPEIVAANRDRIADPDRVQPGTELRLP